jgi:hypothetical protein
MGMKIPPGSLVLGSPAKIRRQLTLEEQTDIARGPGATSKQRSSTANFSNDLWQLSSRRIETYGFWVVVQFEFHADVSSR